MKLAVLVGVTLPVASTALAQGTTPALDVSKPVTMKLVDARLDEAIEMVAQLAGISIQWDARVSAEARSRPAAPVTVTFRDASVDEALALLTRRAGLAVVVVDPKTVRIVVAAR
ncbi:MAG: hypothetical protein AB7P34_18375 [Vicinamibacterales bacterium]